MNCLTYVATLLWEMNIPITAAMAEFTLDKFLNGEHGKTIQAIRDHPEIDDANLDNETLLKDLGDLYRQAYTRISVNGLN